MSAAGAAELGFPMSELVLGEMVVIRFTPGTGGLAPEAWGGGRGGDGGGGRPEPVRKGEAGVSRSSPRAAARPPHCSVVGTLFLHYLLKLGS